MRKIYECIELLEYNYGVLVEWLGQWPLPSAEELEDGLKQQQASMKTLKELIEKELQERDLEIYQLKKNAKGGRPPKYAEYYDLICNLYLKEKSIRKVKKEMENMGVDISTGQISNILNDRGMIENRDKTVQ